MFILSALDPCSRQAGDSEHKSRDKMREQGDVLCSLSWSCGPAVGSIPGRTEPIWLAMVQETWMRPVCTVHIRNTLGHREVSFVYLPSWNES